MDSTECQVTRTEACHTSCTETDLWGKRVSQGKGDGAACLNKDSLSFYASSGWVLCSGPMNVLCVQVQVKMDRTKQLTLHFMNALCVQVQVKMDRTKQITLHFMNVLCVQVQVKMDRTKQLTLHFTSG